MAQPTTHFARAGDADIAYQVLGDGPVDLVWVFGLMTHLEVKWEEPSLAAMIGQLSEFSRLILFDRRGCGLSDRGDRHLAPTLEDRVADIVAVLDAVGSTRASILGFSEGCALAALFASMYPDRTERIVLYGGLSRLLRDEEHPWGVMDRAELEEAYGPVIEHWGTPAGAAAQVQMIAPTAAEDRDYVSWFARQQRQSLSRDAVVRFLRTVTEYDMDGVFPAVRVPTLVLHRTDDTAVPFSSAQRIASRIPGATLVELPGIDHLPYVGDAEAVVEAIRDFVGEPTRLDHVDRRLMTLLATDAADPEAEALVRRQVNRFDGVQVDGPAGGTIARFVTATSAVRCGLGILEASRRRREALRVAVHVGECEIVRTRLGGPAARVPGALVELATPGQVLVTATVRDVVAGSELDFVNERRVRLFDTLAPYAVLVVVPGDGEPRAESNHDGETGACPVFRLDGEYWTVVFEGRVMTLRDSRGMHNLRTLLACPGQERHVLDLWSSGEVGVELAAGSDQAVVADAGLRLVGVSSGVLDDQASAQYRHRLRELEREIADAEQSGMAVVGPREERDWLVDQLASAYGLGGRRRRIPDEVERARKAIWRRIADALRRIEMANPVLGRHLRRSVRTGVYCSYIPERDIRWETGVVQPGPASAAGR